MHPDTFDFEICVPVTEPVAAAWGEFDAWIKGRGYTPGPDLWECYAVGPEASPDPAAWRTELNRPLIGRLGE